ncbi:MAG: YfiM family protein [Candidatus Delongbacteria bacterium]|nr:YfiM family protein [Candidatus Delongbacteria bacterium]MCG2759922.1 YfiM family protein [Candidatus Delongbacteria bacterium]
MVKNAWWSGESVPFHFDTGADLKYAKNLDKAGHFFGGYLVQDMYYNSLTWSGVSKRNAVIWSTGLSVFVQIMIDIKDAYSPLWGFSVWDVASGSLGAGYGALQRIYPVLENYDFKFSYYYREDGFPSIEAEENRKLFLEDFVEDYPNQTYWLTANLNGMLPQSRRGFIPDYLGLALGLSVDDKIGNENSGSYELYLSLDLDLEKIVEPLNNKVISSIAHYLNFIKVPAPTLRLYPSSKGYWLYM